ncbi:MAG: hypothetical protein LBF28_03295 [Rickettsiales bacterium]|nr:hypothetical protein [Rickettsiales bacterium]
MKKITLCIFLFFYAISNGFALVVSGTQNGYKCVADITSTSNCLGYSCISSTTAYGNCSPWFSSSFSMCTQSTFVGPITGASDEVKNVCTTSTAPTSCQAGYYLSGASCAACARNKFKSDTGTGACTSCATATENNAAATASTGSAAITECYIPSGIEQTDTTGTFSYEENCFYAEQAAQN